MIGTSVCNRTPQVIANDVILCRALVQSPRKAICENILDGIPHIVADALKDPLWDTLRLDVRNSIRDIRRAVVGHVGAFADRKNSREMKGRNVLHTFV